MTSGVSVSAPYPSGAVFSSVHKNSSVETAFKYAVDRINRDQTILPHSRLEYDIRYVAADDSFHATKEGERSTTTLLQFS